MPNIEALASGGDEKPDCSYNREDGCCTVKIGVGGKIKIAGVGIVKADASGEISFDGKVICPGGGNNACRPVECIDLYEVILKKQPCFI